MPPMPLSELRERLHLSQKELGERAGVAETTIWAIENQGRRPHPRNRREIARVLGVEPNAIAEFVGERDSADDPPPDRTEP